MEVKFYDFIEDSLIKFVVIVSRYKGKWVLCKHKKRNTYEVPGGRREKGETVRQAAKRELYEETGAIDYILKPAAVYSVTGSTRVNESGEESFGMLYYAEIQRFEPELHYEIEKIVFMEELPESMEVWTYPLIQLTLIEKVTAMGYVIKKEELLGYVRTYLDKKQGNLPQNSNQGFRKRYEHIVRVVQWAELLSKEIELDYNALVVAAIFHDVGYEATDNENHAERSAAIFKQFAMRKDWDTRFVEKVYDFIRYHSRKDLMGSDIPLELVILMEADLMDEEGSMRIVRDCMTVGADNPESYKDTYYYLSEHKKTGPNPMITEKAKRIWKAKKKIEHDFIEELKNDLFLE